VPKKGLELEPFSGRPSPLAKSERSEARPPRCTAVVPQKRSLLHRRQCQRLTTVIQSPTKENGNADVFLGKTGLAERRQNWISKEEQF